MNVLTLATCEEITRQEIVTALINDFQDGWFDNFYSVAKAIVDDLEEIELRDAESLMPTDWE